MCYLQSKVDSLVYENIGLKRAIDDLTKELDLRKNRKFRLHSTSWYKRFKKFEDIVNRDRCMCQIIVWYED